MDKTIKDKIKEKGGIIKTDELVSFGVSKPTIASYVKKGELIKPKYGVYALPGAFVDDLYIISLVTKSVIVSHEEALFLNGLSNRTPNFYSFTLIDGAKLSPNIKDCSKCYYVKKQLINIGLETRKTMFGNTVPCYNAERTICDLLRSKNRIDNEIIVSAIKNYFASNDKNIARLGEYARIFKVEDEVRKYSEVFLKKIVLKLGLLIIL